MKIISGGQTGVDRAALDVALKLGIDCGGWCPAGRLDERGRIPDRYPLTELEGGGFAERTLRNVMEADGTVVVHSGTLAGGTKRTVEFCIEAGKQHLVIDASQMSPPDAAEAIAGFVSKNEIKILNVAGPRLSQWPEGHAHVFEALERFLNRS